MIYSNIVIGDTVVLKHCRIALKIVNVSGNIGKKFPGKITHLPEQFSFQKAIVIAPENESDKTIFGVWVGRHLHNNPLFSKDVGEKVVSIHTMSDKAWDVHDLSGAYKLTQRGWVKVKI